MQLSGDFDSLLTAASIATRLGMSEAAVRIATSRGKLPAVRLGRRVRYRWPDVVAAFVPAQAAGGGR
jgi:hypothetical protein